MMVQGYGTEFEATITPMLIISCTMAATGGLMFGYEVGVSGGIMLSDSLLEKLFRKVYNDIEKQSSIQGMQRNYCQYDNQPLQLFIFSLYLVASISTFFASYSTTQLGRRFTIFIAGIFFITGVLFDVAAQNLAMLIVGRIFIGCGVGFGNQVIPLFLSEIAPTQIRGGFNLIFQLNITIGILFSNIVNYGTNKIEGRWGWRLWLGLGGIPAGLLTLGALIIKDTPNSLMERGYFDEAKAVLLQIRGKQNIEPELLQIVEASRVSKLVKHPFRHLLKPANRPQLIMATSLQVFQQLTGINVIMFFAPLIFKELGMGQNASIYSAVIIGAVNVFSTVVSIYLVDRVGRRMLLKEAGVQMFFSLLMIATILGIKVTDHKNNLSDGYAIFVVIMVCAFVSAFAWSWGPLGWLIPSETFPLETRSAGQSVSVCVNMIFTFITGQTFLYMLCHFKFGIFLFFSGWVVIMSVFVVLFLPETKNIPIEEMKEKVWKQHWFWKRYMGDDELEVDVGSM